jgi:hypothetical protein
MSATNDFNQKIIGAPTNPDWYHEEKATRQIPVVILERVA